MGEFENLEGLCWENFFDQVDKQFNEEVDEEGESKWNGGGSNEIVAFSGVATLPHDKAVCYGVCTVSQVPKLVKCEDCSLVVKMVGFGHHRKFRHRESRLFLARQSVKDAEDSSNSDSNDDCQGFLLSPPHHHLSVASTSEASSIFEGHQWRTTHPLDPSSKAPSSSLKQTAGPNKQQQSSKTNEPPRLYGVEKWNDLRLVLKRTPEKAASQNAEHQHNSIKNAVEQENVEDVSTKKLRKPPPSRAIGSKRKRKKKTNKRTKESDDDEEVANVEDESPQSAGKVYQPSNNDLQECDTFTDDAEHDDSFVTIPTQLTTPSNDDSFVTIPTQLTPSTAANFWDPREAAGRPDVVKGTFKKTPLSSKLTSSHSAPIRKTTLNLSVKQFQQATSFTSSNLIQTNMESNKRDTNLDKIAGPSILKRPGQLTSPPQYHHQQNIHKNEEKSVGSVQQIYNKYSGINYKNPEQEQPQNLNLQNQFSKMQQQIQKQRGLTRDFDAISPKSNRKTTPEEVDRPDSRHSPSSDTSSSTSNIYMDSQESTTLTKTTNDSTCHSNFVNKLPNNVVQSNEFSCSTQFIHEAISNSQKPPTMFRLLGRTPTTGSNENKTTTIIVKNSPSNNAQWKGTDSNSSNSPISTPQQRKISSASFSGRSHYISPSGTRFVPVDPRGLVSMQKNSASNSITSSKSNSPIAAIPSTPSPASYINSPPRCEIINPNVDIRTPRGETNQNIFGVDYEQQHQFISSTPKTINNIISSSTITTTTANRRQPQHFPSTNQTNSNFFRKRQIVEEMTPQALMTSTPNRFHQQQRTPTSSITHSNIKRFRPVMASQEGDHQQYACIDSFPSDTPILHPPRVRTLYPQKQQHSTISASPIPGTSTSMVDIQQPTCYQISYQNQIVNQRIHPSSSQQHFTTSNTLGQQHPPSQPFRQAFTSTIQQQQRQQHHYLRQQQHNLRTQLNRGINTSTYFPKSLSSLSGEFALEHQQQHYSQRHQQQFNINSPTEDPPFNEYIIGSPPPSEQQQQHFPERIATSGLYEQTENPSGMNIMRRADQQQQLLPSPYNYSTTPTSTPTTIRRLPVINPQQQMQINHQQQHFILPSSSSNRFTSSTNIAHNNNIPLFLQQQTNIPMDYNNLQQHAHQQLSYHQRATTMTEYRPGMEPIDTHAIDPPPILEAEGRLSVMETISSSSTSIPSVYNRQQQLSVVCSNESNTSATMNLATPNKNSNNEEDAGTRSSSASDLDLREIVNNNNIPSSQ
uniref:Uncharacterized protein n=1 Tax=Meloidogyne floridensis TaxID=298350 RepID=A0A915NX40_9BILA